MSFGVITMYVGGRYGVRCAVALHSLRKHYSGPISMFVSPVESPLADKLCAAANVTPIVIAERRPQQRTRRRFWCNWLKAQCIPKTPYRRTMWIDMDTVTRAPIDPFAQHLDDVSIVATQFLNLTTHSAKMGGRILEARGLDPELDAAVNAQTKESHPTINTGVFAFDDSPYARSFMTDVARWCSLSFQALKITSGVDEIMFQLMCSARPGVRVISGSRWNNSPWWQRPDSGNAAIVHYHGTVGLCAGIGSPWVRELRSAWDANFANIRRWGRREMHDIEKYLAITAP